MANENMKMSAAGYTALRINEGVVLHFYNDAPVNGNCTWGVGTLEHLGPCSPEELRRAVLPDQVNAILVQRVHEAERIVRAVVTDHQLTQAQFDSAVSFAYNSTTKNIRNALAPANNGNMAEVAARMRRNVMVRPRNSSGHTTGHARINHGLVNRRNREIQPFLRDAP